MLMPSPGTRPRASRVVTTAVRRSGLVSVIRASSLTNTRSSLAVVRKSVFSSYARQGSFVTLVTIGAGCERLFRSGADDLRLDDSSRGLGPGAADLAAGRRPAAEIGALLPPRAQAEGTLRR